mgnify:CR=1 FL=1
MRKLHSIEEEIIDACRDVGATPLDSWPEYKMKLIVATTKLSDEEVESLTERTQNWIDAGIEAANNGQDIPEFGPEFLPDDPDADPEDYRTKAGHSRSSNYWANYKSASARAREILLEEGLSYTVKQLMSQLEQEGYQYTGSTIKLVRSEFRRACSTLYHAGYFAEEPPGLQSMLRGDRRTARG